MVWVWLGFIAFILLMLALDLGVFHREAHVVGVREALVWSGIWAAMGLSFSVFVYFAYQVQWFGLGTVPDPVDGTLNRGVLAAEKYLTGYVVEKSLSIDNIFVIALIFGAFAVPQIYQHRVLFWGVIGALLMRGVMIAVGATLIARFHWMLYVFATFLILTAARMLLFREDNPDPTQNIIVRLTRRLFPVTERLHGEHFVVRAGSSAAREAEVPGGPLLPDAALARAPAGKRLLTPLALALILVESADLVFAVDSIPAIFAITGDAFLVFTSNVFAMLGLRSLYFALGGMLQRFRYLKVALALILLVVGLKMLFVEWLKLALGSYFNLYLLSVVLGIIAAGIALSLWAERRDGA